MEITNYIYGASGHGKVIASICKALQINITGFIDDNAGIAEFNNLLVIQKLPSTESNVIIAIGDNKTREKIAQNFIKFLILVHPSSCIDKSVTIGEGSVVMQSSCIQIDTKIGKHVIVNTSASIDHDCKIEDFVHVSPNATLAGGVFVGKGSWIGAGATIIQGVKIGKNVVVGAGSVVLKDIPDNTVYAGVPAKFIKNNY